MQSYMYEYEDVDLVDQTGNRVCASDEMSQLWKRSSSCSEETEGAIGAARLAIGVQPSISSYDGGSMVLIGRRSRDSCVIIVNPIAT